MKAATNSGFGRSSRIYLRDYPKPSANKNNLLVEVYASSVNPKDWKYITLLNQWMPRIGPLKPFVLGDDVAGVVVEKGSAVTDFNIGDRVYGMSVYPTTGALAEYVLLDQRCAALKPHNVSYSAAAGVPLAGLTALQALRAANVGPNSNVLILGAAGGVGCFATQIAKALGASVTGLCSKRNIELVRALGADMTIDYTEPGCWIPPDRFDVIFDAVSLYSLRKCSSCLKENAFYVVALGDAKSAFNLFCDRFSDKKKQARFVLVNSNHKDLNILKSYIESARLKPVIDSEYAFEEVQEAYSRSRTGRAVGKIIVNVKSRQQASRIE